MGLLIVNEEKCNQDGFCVADCPMGIIAMPEGGYPQVMDGAEAACIACGHCVAVCPFEALSHPQVKADDCLPLKKDLAIGPDQAAQFLRSRRSIRQYKTEAVDRAVMEQWADMARFAQTGHNSQTVAMKVFYDTPTVRRLSDHVVDWMRMLVEKDEPMAAMLNMPLIIQFYDQGIDLVFRGAPHVALTHAHAKDRFADHSCDIAATYLELYAPTLGLGTCWAGYFERACGTWEPLKEALGLPEGHIVKNAMMVGLPKVRYFRCPQRKPLNITWA